MIYRHRRVGRGGQMFFCLKFRTMVPNADQVLRDLLASDSEDYGPNGCATTSCGMTHVSRNSDGVCAGRVSTSCRNSSTSCVEK